MVNFKTNSIELNQNEFYSIRWSIWFVFDHCVNMKISSNNNFNLVISFIWAYIFFCPSADMRTPYKSELEHLTESELPTRNPFELFKLWFEQVKSGDQTLESNAVCLATSDKWVIISLMWNTHCECYLLSTKKIPIKLDLKWSSFFVFIGQVDHRPGWFYWKDSMNRTASPYSPIWIVGRVVNW